MTSAPYARRRAFTTADIIVSFEAASNMVRSDFGYSPEDVRSLRRAFPNAAAEADRRLGRRAAS